jgi:hypothetical protein
VFELRKKIHAKGRLKNVKSDSNFPCRPYTFLTADALQTEAAPRYPGLYHPTTNGNAPIKTAAITDTPAFAIMEYTLHLARKEYL